MLEHFAGSGERSHTKSLAMLLDAPTTQRHVVGALAKCVRGGIPVSEAYSVRREAEIVDGAQPDIVLDSNDSIVMIEAKLLAGLTRAQKEKYLAALEDRTRPNKALLFLVPRAQAERFEREVATLAGVKRFRDAQEQYRRRNVVLDVITWNQLADELDEASTLPEFEGRQVAEFVTLLRSGGAREKADDAAIPLTFAQTQLLSSSAAGGIFEAVYETDFLLEDVLKDLTDVWPLKRQIGADDDEGAWVAETKGKARDVAEAFFVGLNEELWSLYGHGPLWVWWHAPTGMREPAARDLQNKIRARGVACELERHEREGKRPRELIRLAVPLKLSAVGDVRQMLPSMKEQFEHLFSALGFSRS